MALPKTVKKLTTIYIIVNIVPLYTYWVYEISNDSIGDCTHLNAIKE